ncbi:hypothetical protein [Parasitella parasitica]|uniref:Uncharacterized protein n=1 Tax=Parasitella parasitica TaxID=35722 RepID=A0A0B7NQH8_9FUNG|nr:hypothetical protein [Parasitella parasitica]
MKCPTCGGTDHARSSSKNCSERVKGKKEAFKEFTKAAVIKISLIKCCKYKSVVSEIQKLVAHITQVVFAGSIFANYYCLDQIQNKEVPSEINQNLIYQLFFVITGQGKKANDELQACFKKFCESIPNSFDLNEYKGQGYSTIIPSMAKQYETLVQAIMNQELVATYWKANAKDCKWQSYVDKNDENNSLDERTPAFWSKFDVTGAKHPTVPNVYGRPHHYLKWTHEIQREMSEKQFIQENVSQQTATPGYVYREQEPLKEKTKRREKKELELITISKLAPYIWLTYTQKTVPEQLL